MTMNERVSKRSTSKQSDILPRASWNQPPTIERILAVDGECSKGLRDKPSGRYSRAGWLVSGNNHYGPVYE
jgi:hypothetical protein